MGSVRVGEAGWTPRAVPLGTTGRDRALLDSAVMPAPEPGLVKFALPQGGLEGPQFPFWVAPPRGPGRSWPVVTWRQERPCPLGRLLLGFLLYLNGCLSGQHGSTFCPSVLAALGARPPPSSWTRPAGSSGLGLQRLLRVVIEPGRGQRWGPGRREFVSLGSVSTCQNPLHSLVQLLNIWHMGYPQPFGS